MDNLQLEHMPVARTGMLIRKPVADVFEAFIDPDITNKFWFTKGNSKLQVGKQVKWEWEMYGASTQVTAKVIEPNRRIVIEWDGYSGLTTVEWRFAAQSAQGFTWTLAGLKAFLEHDIRLNLVADRYPKGPGDPYPGE